jgi:hypothetical protein
MKVDKGSCANTECGRVIDRTFQRLNQTQTNYCSVYCNRYTTEGLTKVLASNSKHHKNLYKFPIIETHCEHCGDTVEMKWQYNKSNKHYCTKLCRDEGKKKLPKRRGQLLVNILRLLRDNGKVWWDANAVAKVINDKQSVYTVTGKSIGNHMKYLVAKGYVKVKDNRNKSNEYRFSPTHKNKPLVLLLTQTLK